jgi:hypothetical protein
MGISPRWPYSFMFASLLSLSFRPLFYRLPTFRLAIFPLPIWQLSGWAQIQGHNVAAGNELRCRTIVRIQSNVSTVVLLIVSWAAFIVFLASVLRLQVTVNVVPSSLILVTVVMQRGPPLWSNVQSSWLQIQGSRFRFPAIPDLLRNCGSGTVSTQSSRYEEMPLTWYFFAACVGC